jgi:anaerobic magnesium-protoporphyrin IX monomethyl ester cyclase
MRCLLTHAYFLYEDLKEIQIMRPYPPLGILYLSAYLKSRGFAVDVYDSTFGSRQELHTALETGEPGLLGIYANLLTRASAVRIIEHGRALGWTVVAGGPEPANYPDEYLDAGAAYVVPGEGELVLEQLLRGSSTPNGVIHRARSGAVERTPPMPLIPDLDALPWPDREAINVDEYLRVWRERHAVGSVSLITARGCPFRCRWCSHSTYGMTHRRRSVEAVCDEVEGILERYAPEMLWYADDVFTIHKSWTIRFAAELLRRGIRTPFECITRADRLDAAVASALREAGCFRVWIGSESGSQRVLDSMQRGVKVQQVREAVRLVREQGIQSGMFLMWGYEGEQASDIEATAEHVAACNPDLFLTTVAYPIKGTPYFAEVSERLVPLGEWRDRTDRDVRVQGRHSRRFYGHADELLRATVAGNSAAAAAARAGMHDTAAEVEA